MKCQVPSMVWPEWRHAKQIVVTALVLLSLAPRVFSQASLFDSSFAIGPGANGPVNSILVLNDGKILVGGEFTEIAGQPQPYLARLDGDGRLDPSFTTGTDGPVYRLLQQPDGRILVAGGFTNLQGVARQTIGRLLTNGVVDLDFDAGTNFGSDEIVLTLGLQPGGKVLAASSVQGWPRISNLRRLCADGQLDDSFVTTNYFDWAIFAILVRTNGTILVGGGFPNVNGIPRHGLALLDSDGHLNTDFGPILTSNSNPTCFIELTNGNIMVGGILYRTDTTNRMLLAQLTPSLQWDTSVNTDEFSPVGMPYSFVRAVLQQRDGKYVVAGNFYEVGGYWRRHVARLDSQGHVDPCFDPGLGLGGFDGAYTLARQPDGPILVGGSFVAVEPSHVNLTRFLQASDCGVTRVYLRMDHYNSVAATCAPGGTNLLQFSTNLADWVTANSTTSPYIYLAPYPFPPDRGFFRVKKEF